MQYSFSSRGGSRSVSKSDFIYSTRKCDLSRTENVARKYAIDSIRKDVYASKAKNLVGVTTE